MRAIVYFVLAIIAGLVIIGTFIVISYNNDVARHYTELQDVLAPALGLA